MTGIYERLRGWLGWCPDARFITNPQPGIPVHPPDNLILQPDGGSPGSRRIGRGKDIAAESMKILVRNGRLLWFSFLIFLIFLYAIVTDRYIRSVFGTEAFFGEVNFPAILGFALTGTAAFIGHFLFLSLAAGLVVCVSQIAEGNSMSLREGLSRVWHHKRPLAGWSLIGALLWIPAGVFAYGFYLITVFALPAMVLDTRDLITALRESLLVFRNILVETYISFGIILLITIGVILATLFSLGRVAFASGLMNEGFPPGIISLVVSVLMAIGLVVMGIATCILYTYEKTGFPRDR